MHILNIGSGSPPLLSHSTVSLADHDMSSMCNQASFSGQLSTSSSADTELVIGREPIMNSAIKKKVRLLFLSRMDFAGRGSII